MTSEGYADVPASQLEGWLRESDAEVERLAAALEAERKVSLVTSEAYLQVVNAQVQAMDDEQKAIAIDERVAVIERGLDLANLRAVMAVKVLHGLYDNMLEGDLEDPS